MPAVLPLSIPVGLAIGAALSAQRRILSRRLIGAIMLFALALSVASLVTVAWVTPNTNQSYREALIGNTLRKGDREMTLIELRRSLAMRDPEGARRVLLEFHHRLSFALTPLTFAAFGLVVAIRRLRVMGALGAVGLAAFGYDIEMWMALGLSQDAVLPAYLGPWMPQVALMLTTVLVGLPSGRTQPNTRVS